MSTFLNIPAIGLMALVLSTPAFADTATVAPTAAECEAQFKALDTDNSGTLTEVESAQVFARARVANQTIADTGYTKDEFLKACATNDYGRPAPVAGAPLEGANSFTEGQAKDRATAWGVTAVSTMTKDDKGVWRGTGILDGANVAVAVDFKGNVVTTSK